MRAGTYSSIKNPMKAVMKVAPGVGQIMLQEIDEPEPGTEEVKLKVHAAGICGTDIHIWLDEFKSRPPVALGHEVCGEVVGLGERVRGVALGDRVTTETYYATCTRCRYCRAGHCNLCLDRYSIGSAVNGGFAEYVVVPAASLHRLPAHISYREGALTEPLACAVQGVQLCSIPPRAGEVAVIAGPGTMGLLTLQLVKAAGAQVVMLGTDADARRLSVAEALGADHIFNVNTRDPLPLIEDVTHGALGADVVYECSGAGPAAAQLLRLVRRRGRYVQVGLFGGPIQWDLDQVCYKELVVTGSNASTPESWLRAVQLLADGTVVVRPLITHDYALADWEAAFETFRTQRGIKTLFRPQL